MKIAVIGGDGQLGADVVKEFKENGNETVSLTHGSIEIVALESVRNVLNEIRPQVIVNTAAMHHVENCEKEPLRAYEVNVLGARNLAIVARELNAKLFHISTDYVFDGNKQGPYCEEDHAIPLNVYGNTKLAGELFIRATWRQHFILRTSALYGRSPCRAKGGRNFVELMINLARERDEIRVVDDEVVSPTCTSELAKQIALLSKTDEFGLYHATAEGSCSWHGFAKKIFALTRSSVKLKVAGNNEFPAKVPRPKYSVLENQQLKRLGLNTFRAWEDGLRTYLAANGHMRELDDDFEKEGAMRA